MLPIVAIRPAVAMSSCASVLNTGQMPEQQSTAECPPARASSVHHAEEAARCVVAGADAATATPLPATIADGVTLRGGLPNPGARGSSSNDQQYAADGGGNENTRPHPPLQVPRMVSRSWRRRDPSSPS